MFDSTNKLVTGYLRHYKIFKDYVAIIKDINLVFQKLKSVKLCPGNPDEKFSNLLLQNNKTAAKDGTLNTIRHNECEMKIQLTATRCAKCSSYRSTLRRLRLPRSKSSSEGTEAQSRKSFACLTESELRDRARSLLEFQKTERIFQITHEAETAITKGNSRLHKLEITTLASQPLEKRRKN